MSSPCSATLPVEPPAAAAARRRLEPDTALVAIDVGGTTTRVGALLANEPPRPEAMLKVPSASLGEDPAESLARLIVDAVPRGQRLAGAVVGLPVCLDEHGRTALSSPNLPGFVGHDMAALLEARLSAPVVADRDTTLLATGEWVAGAAQGFRTVAGIFIGTGVGGCMLVDGVPYRGSSGGSVEVGHIPVRDHGRACVCGNTDCLEAYASGHTLEALAREAQVPVGEVFTHERTASGVADYVRALAHGLATVVNILDPDVLLIGGGLHGRPHFPRTALAEQIRAHLRAPAPRERVAIRHATLGSAAALYGAPLVFARHH